MDTVPEDRFIEEIALYFEDHGLPRMAGRVLAWLLICEPALQSMQQVGDRLSASKGSISTTLRMLMQLGLVEKTTSPAQRRDLYRLTPDFTERLLAMNLRRFIEFRKIAARGLSLLDGMSEEQRARIQEMHDLNLFLEHRFPSLVEQWHSEKSGSAVGQYEGP
jgi:DNA-binding transcriptional regulator GbsR (MarR family)